MANNVSAFSLYASTVSSNGYDAGALGMMLSM